jgi:hypothetical protein
MPRFSNRPFLATTLSFLSSRPGFPATLRWTWLRVRLSRKERRMKFANATNLNRKSGGAKPRDLRCAIRVPRSYRPQPSTNHHRILMETTTSPLSFRVSRVGPRNRRSLGFARDDKKGRVAERRGLLPRDRAIVGAVGTSTTRHLHRQQPFCAKSRKSQPLGMTKRVGLLKGEDRCQGAGRLLGPWGRRRPDISIDSSPFVRNQESHNLSG